MSIGNGGISLVISAGTLIALEGMRHFGVISAPSWQIAQSAAEGATVGGLADWFAVSALFRRIPIPLLSRHTDIVRRSRGRVTESLADLVQNEWLAPNSIRAHLESVSLCDMFLKYMEQEEKRLALLEYAKAGGQQLTQQLTSDKSVDWLESILENQVRSESVHEFLTNEILDAIKQLEESENLMHKWATKAAKALFDGETDQHKAAGLATIILEKVSGKLATGDLVRDVLLHTQSTLIEQLSDPDSRLHAELVDSVEGMLESLRKNEELRARIDRQVKESILQVLEESRGMIGNIVRTSLSPENMSDRELVKQIEDRVGEELQWIRVNGAVVGGAAAGVIGTLRLVLG
jgi:uncharacterized membrane-anchored protein YjiN (DUF445 family)